MNLNSMILCALVVVNGIFAQHSPDPTRFYCDLKTTKVGVGCMQPVDPKGTVDKCKSMIFSTQVLNVFFIVHAPMC